MLKPHPNVELEKGGDFRIWLEIFQKGLYTNNVLNLFTFSIKSHRYSIANFHEIFFSSFYTFFLTTELIKFKIYS